MTDLQAKEPFHFYSSVDLVELTGRKAGNLLELLQGVKEVPGSSIFYHTHQAFLQHHFLTLEYPNDFAYWVSEVAEEKTLGEKLASLSIGNYTSIASLRADIVTLIEEYLEKVDGTRRVPPGEEFYFSKCITLAFPTKYSAFSLSEFVEALSLVSTRSIFYHFIEARIRLERNINDFSNWIRYSVGNESLAERIERLDPYMLTLEELREAIIETIKKARME